MFNRYNTLFVPIPFVGVLKFDKQAHHFDRGMVHHGPWTWPWWQWFSVNLVRTNPDGPQTPGWNSFNLWVYRRNSASVRWVCLDRTGR